ncbi:delta-60 repeat domain-containing protein [Catellatospora sp. KI3]|uniref:delta-60 repeat domain-containing protein n=1 Tax=Catellatospora sp. KI3 TaxID=3041620 RepID=UPI002482A5EB|nr:delta-60 repeat domain-containing protein [Catellatospora sp. KI3]MDI1464349.1 delta-60 repeat domain-containing protein [Catellatospora sp. KI3]
MRRRVISLAALAVLAAVGAAAAPEALARPRAADTVGEDPVDWTPHVLDGEVEAITVVGDTVVVGGEFSTVVDSEVEYQYERRNIFAFDLRTGAVLDFAPDVDGEVMSLAPGPDGSVFVGGAFQGIDGRYGRGLARLDLATGEPVEGFDAMINWGDVRALVPSGGWLYLAGSFSAVDDVARLGLARIDPDTGAVDPRFDARLSAPEIGRVKVEDIAITPSGDRLLAVGAFTRVGSTRRVQAAMFDLTRPKATLAPWSTDAYTPLCRDGFDTYMRGADFSPDGGYLVIVTTGRLSGRRLTCDTAARFETYAPGRTDPTWVNHTGGDSLYAVEIIGGAVYVGGHQRWLDNPYGHESEGPGAVSRPGVGAIHPETGMALPWNPTRTRGVGVKAFAATPLGLLVGSDTDELGREFHGRVGLFPRPE